MRRLRARGQKIAARTLTTAVVMITTLVATTAHAETLRDQQWHLAAMRADDVWQMSTGKGVTVAVIDSGVDPNVADLQGRVLPGKDFAPQRGTAHDDREGHGTGMAAIIAGTGRGKGGHGSMGLAPDVKILPVRVYGDANVADGSANVSKYLARISDAIRFAADSDAQIVNISLGFFRGSKQLTSAVRYAIAKNKLIFASTGNSGKYDEPVDYPAAVSGIVAVGAVGSDAKATGESQHGPEVDLAAPGEDIVHACLGRGTVYCRSHGTSAASALASASAALIWAEHPDWTANQVLRVMINTAGKPTDGVKRNDYIGYGVVRPRVALKDPGDPGPADVSPLPEVAALEKPETPEKTGKPEKPRPRGSSEQAAGKRERTAGREEKDGNLVPVGLGVGGVIVVLGVVTAVFVRRRRSASSASG